MFNGSREWFVIHFFEKMDRIIIHHLAYVRQNFLKQERVFFVCIRKRENILLK